jgi:hypothetical protein
MSGRDLCRVEPGTVGLTPAQGRAVVALAGGATVTAAAEAGGVSRPTVYAWLDGVPEFVAELNRARAEARDAIRAELRSLAVDAVAAMRELITSNETPPAIRLRAAMTVISTVGADFPEPIGSTVPDEVRGQFSNRDLMRAIGSL